MSIREFLFSATLIAVPVLTALGIALREQNMEAGAPFDRPGQLGCVGIETEGPAVLVGQIDASVLMNVVKKLERFGFEIVVQRPLSAAELRIDDGPLGC